MMRVKLSALMWWRSLRRNPWRHVIVTVVVAASTILLVLAIQIAQSFLHANEVQKDRATWLSLASEHQLIAIDLIEFENQTVELWTISSSRPQWSESFPGISSHAPAAANFWVSPRLDRLASRDSLAGTQFSNRRTLSDDGVVAGEELFAIKFSPQRDIRSRPNRAKAILIGSTESLSLPSAPAWIGVAGSGLLLVSPALGLLVAAALLGGRVRSRREQVLGDLGAGRVARHLAAIEGALSGMIATVIPVALVSLLGPLTTVPMVGSSTLGSVWSVGWAEAGLIATGVTGVFGLLCGLVGQRRPRPEGREKLLPGAGVLLVAGLLVFLVPSVVLAREVAFGAKMLGLVLLSFALLPSLPRFARFLGERWRETRWFPLSMAAASVSHQPRSWTGRWYPLAVGCLLTIPLLVSVVRLSEDDSVQPSSGTEEPQLYAVRFESAAGLAQIQSPSGVFRSDVLVAPFISKGSGIQLQISCRDLSRSLNFDECADGRRQLARTIGYEVTVRAPSVRTKSPSLAKALVVARDSPDGRELVRQTIAAERGSYISELGASTAQNSTYLRWLIGGLGLSWLGLMLALFMVLADRDVENDGAQRLRFLGVPANVRSTVAGLTFLLGFGAAIGPAMALGTSLLLIAWVFNPNDAFPWLSVGIFSAALVVLGIAGSFAAALTSEQGLHPTSAKARQ